jgi:hypothetical protein
MISVIKAFGLGHEALASLARTAAQRQRRVTGNRDPDPSPGNRVTGNRDPVSGSESWKT